ncbi:DJ-1/PfpI family protein [Sphingobacterium zeae]|uniref:Molecular chaperone Hsp31 and glyoxalase 3 n=1 Tax=Sphingobacterium zeae TaxID=1776859 RepID=A0ABU0U5K5_9SPHI|nr:DJ-1/PfpI family protein [Sphingobacterium zeae]MDQ1150233.1 molecular chaperone Hsp31 and glyoxalase 3 [Sphingobacterium zeae]
MSLFSKDLSKEPVFDGLGYEPSFFSRKAMVTTKTDYSKKKYDEGNKDTRKKILVLCTEERYMTMKNGKKFSTGNHPVETLVPILHFDQAGFDVDFYTPTGGTVKFEMWAMPYEDEHIGKILEKYNTQFSNPHSLQDFVADTTKSYVDYVAVFIPGGHGAMLGLPENNDVKELIKWVIAEDKFMLTICHGPAALLSAAQGIGENDFPYKGYKINSFPDEMDLILPQSGYQPGEMPWLYGEKLKQLGVEILNKKISGDCHVDRKLITADSPLAADKFGKICVEELLADEKYKAEN